MKTEPNMTTRLGVRVGKLLPRKAKVAVAALCISAAVSGLAYALNARDNGRSVTATSTVAGRLAQHPVMSKAPWIWQPAGSPSIHSVVPLPSIVFPEGVDYDEALRRLYVATVETGDLPTGVTLAPPLASTTVVEYTKSGVRLSLTAPFGYSPGTGAILPPSYSLPGSLSPGDVQALIKEADASGVALPVGAEVDIPKLAGCQIQVADAPTAC